MKRIFICFALFLSFNLLSAQKVANRAIKERIEKYKVDPRGPYKDIRWFCKDGSFVLPKEKCPEPGGVQRARYKDEVIVLAQSNHVFLGQILSKTSHKDFWDTENYHSRLKQYQLEKYLRSIDDGWILRKGQFYRGSYQIEDEEAWGADFLNWLLVKDETVQKHFFLIRQAAKDIPHRGNDNKTMSVRSVSKSISDVYPAFMDLRVKIHGQPEATDIEKVKAFKEKHRSTLTPELIKNFDILIRDMIVVYGAVNWDRMNNLVKQIPATYTLNQSLNAFLEKNKDERSGPNRAKATAVEISKIRSEILSIQGGKVRLALVDLSNALEELFFSDINQWQPTTLKGITEKIYHIGLVVAGTGFAEQWEWDKVAKLLQIDNKEEMSLDELTLYLETARGLIEWGTGMVQGVYKDVVQLYGGFEPKAYGFFDDRIRGSALLPLGMAVGQLGSFLAQKSNLTNSVMNLPNQSTVRGLNPGFSTGELIVVNDQDIDIEVSSDKIYVFNNPPADLKPVAGILTVTEGNMVSHVQLLARNLGIPNAVLSAQNKAGLNRFSGQRVFYAVSKKGTVIMKLASEMTTSEKQLFAEKKRKEERIMVPVAKMDLTNKRVLNMREVNASSSGKLCGPKAANLGQLKLLFPDHVVEGLVLPFGIFRAHLEQMMPGQNTSYWTFLNKTFQTAQSMSTAGQSDDVIERFILKELETLREAIKKMPLLPSFISELEEQFKSVFGKNTGAIPVFIRSDTNMEDLKDFTGAGLNLTIFNVLEKEKIIQGIKDVWASPYTERSFKWRQRYLLNPENVFPSILIIPSVDVDYSGVMITKGIATNDPGDLTVAFNRGAGGAVDGQAAESYLLRHNGGNRLLSPAREPVLRKLPATGGSTMAYTTFDQPILNKENLESLRNIANQVRKDSVDAKSSEEVEVFDVELGFKDNKIWLFQIRPFVENKNALSSEYLESISPKVDGHLKIRLEEKIVK